MLCRMILPLPMSSADTEKHFLHCKSRACKANLNQVADWDAKGHQIQCFASSHAVPGPPMTDVLSGGDAGDGDSGAGNSGRSGGNSGGGSGNSGGSGEGDGGDGHFSIDGSAVSLLVLMLGLAAAGTVLLRFELDQMPKTSHKSGKPELPFLLPCQSLQCECFISKGMFCCTN